MAYFARSYFVQIEPEGREELRETLEIDDCQQPKDCSPPHELGHHYGLLDVPWAFKDELCEDNFGGFLPTSPHYNEEAVRDGLLLDFLGRSESYGPWDSELLSLLDNENVRFVPDSPGTADDPCCFCPVLDHHEDGRFAEGDPWSSESALYYWPLLTPQLPTVLDIFDLLPPSATAVEEADEHIFFNYLRNLGIAVGDVNCFGLQFGGYNENRTPA